MTSEEFEKMYDQISRQVSLDFLEKIKPEVLDLKSKIANENGKADRDIVIADLTAFALTSSMEFSKVLMREVLGRLLVTE